MKKVHLFLLLFIMAISFSCTTNESFTEDEVILKEQTSSRELPKLLCSTTIGPDNHQYYVNENPNGTYTISDDFGYSQNFNSSTLAYELCSGLLDRKKDIKQGIEKKELFTQVCTHQINGYQTYIHVSPNGTYTLSDDFGYSDVVSASYANSYCNGEFDQFE